MQAVIYMPTKTAMQSGRAKTRRWCLIFEPLSAKKIDPLMGWTSSSDTNQQVKLYFSTKEEAIAYCSKNCISYTVKEPTKRKIQFKAYSENFRYDAIK